MFERSSGILLHISSLPGPYGIGTMGSYAYKFIDFLKSSGQSYWQVLPLGHTGFGDSPYQCFSAFAGNPYFIDLEVLCNEGLIDKESLAGYDFGSDIDYIDFGKLYENRYSILREAFSNSEIIEQARFEHFKSENRHWLRDYALFMSIKNHFGGIPLSEWPDNDLKLRKQDALKKYTDLLHDDIHFYEFMQYLFFKQWYKLKRYANKNGIKIIGDVSIYPSADSADVWSCPEMFKLNPDLTPSFVAGVPPDYYSLTGQLWGNPVYDWNEHEKNNFSWWLARLKHSFKMYDIIRIDHFRGFCKYWEIPAGSKDARSGKWQSGPEMKLFSIVNSTFGSDRIIAEDLGMINPPVKKFLKKCGYPGIKTMVFGFDGKNFNNEHMPHCIELNRVAYTSTHDSPPFKAVLNTLLPGARAQAVRYLDIRDEFSTAYPVIRSLWASRAMLAMTTMQDLLSLGEDATMNRPSVAFGNWRWRVREEALNENVRRMLYNLTEDFGRLPYQSEEDADDEY